MFLVLQLVICFFLLFSLFPTLLTSYLSLLASPPPMDPVPCPSIPHYFSNGLSRETSLIIPASVCICISINLCLHSLLPSLTSPSLLTSAAVFSSAMLLLHSLLLAFIPASPCTLVYLCTASRHTVLSLILRPDFSCLSFHIYSRMTHHEWLLLTNGFYHHIFSIYSKCPHTRPKPLPFRWAWIIV